MLVVATSAATNPPGSETELTEYCGACKKRNEKAVFQSLDDRAPERCVHMRLLYNDARRGALKRREPCGDIGSVAVFPWSPARTLGVHP